jgi:hypothetical protein
MPPATTASVTSLSLSDELSADSVAAFAPWVCSVATRYAWVVEAQAAALTGIPLPAALSICVSMAWNCR